ncbi:EAL domain-containing protein [Dietzia sp. CH92]|uniref:putative bifunctional diguanylate cyclase/phosphodiesterase n=1 Tax=Dietzia sp. CH92 TaxID=3051823 RepID=UPI0028D1C549|nr:EAL domain-containing protein [Dietzia sp. CH92]
MKSPTMSGQRLALSAAGLVVATLVGRMGAPQASGLALYWPAVGVIILWVLLVRSARDYAAFVALTLVILTAVPVATGVAPAQAFVLAVANLVAALVTRWVSLALVPVGRRLGFASRARSSPPLPAWEVISRMTVPADVFRLVAATAIGASLSWGIAAVALTLDGSVPSFVEGCVWVVRTLANVLMIAGTGLALVARRGDSRRYPVSDLVMAYVATTALAVIAYLLSPFVPLVLIVLLPLFWSGVRCSPSAAAVHALFTVLVVGGLGWYSEGLALGDDFDPVSWSLQINQAMIVAYLIALVMATGVNEFVRLNDQLTSIAATAETRAVQLRTVNQTIPDALIIVDRAGVATPLNAAGEQFVTTGRDGLTRLVREPHGHHDAAAREETPSARALRGETVRGHRFLHVDRAGTEQAFELTAAPLVAEGGGEPERALLLIRDVSEHHRVLSELEVLAESDPLTGLLNRRRFDREIARHYDLHRLEGTGSGVLVLDLDGFKEINDTFGHSVGDKVLTEVSWILTSTTDPSDFVTRFGGDEFAILIPGADRDRLQALAATLIERIRGYAHTLDGAGRALSASIGGVTFDAADDEGTAPLLLADKLMYDVKNSGRDGFLIVGHCREDRNHTRTPAEWKTLVERAVENDELVLHLQPIIDVDSHAVIGAEVLVRLLDGGELVSPSEFVPVAERAGIAVLLDRWVVRAAVAMAARLRAVDPGFCVWINCSAQSIGNAEIERTLHTSLVEHGVPASAVVIELTETAQIDDVPTAKAQAQRLRAAGVRLAIDDFGTGFGSFIYLKHLLFDYVKVNGEFITAMDTSATDRTIVRSIVDLAGQLQMQVVAENVESDAVMDLVRVEKIHLAQGFGIGRPCPEGEFVARHLDGGGGEAGAGVRAGAGAGVGGREMGSVGGDGPGAYRG